MDFRVKKIFIKNRMKLNFQEPKEMSKVPYVFRESIIIKLLRICSCQSLKVPLVLVFIVRVQTLLCILYN